MLAVALQEGVDWLLYNTVDLLTEADQPNISGHGGPNYQRVLSNLRLEAARREDATALEWQGVTEQLEEQIRHLLGIIESLKGSLKKCEEFIQVQRETIEGYQKINGDLKQSIETHVAHLNGRSC